MLIFCLLFGYPHVQVTSFCVLHDDAQFLFDRRIDLFETDDIRVIQHLHQPHLQVHFLSLFVIQVLCSDPLDDVVLLVVVTLHQVHFAHAAFAQYLDLAVLIDLGYGCFLAAFHYY